MSRVNMDYQSLANSITNNSFILAPEQLNLLDAFDKNDRTVVCKSRQSGASTAILFYAICHCIGRSHSTIALIPPDRHFGIHYEGIVKSLIYSGSNNILSKIDRYTINFNNGSRIVVSPLKHDFQGLAVDAFITDEFAQHQQDTDIYDFINNYPRQVKEIYVSTPNNGTPKEFHNLWRYSPRSQKVKLELPSIPEKISRRQEKTSNFIKKCEEFFKT